MMKPREVIERNYQLLLNVVGNKKIRDQVFERDEFDEDNINLTETAFGMAHALGWVLEATQTSVLETMIHEIENTLQELGILYRRKEHIQ
jgi:hypothetical protein